MKQRQVGLVPIVVFVLLGVLQVPIQGASKATQGKAKVAAADVHAGGQVDVFSGTDRNSVQISSSRFR